MAAVGKQLAKRKRKQAGRGKAPSAATRRELWARSAGVCQYPGCGEVLYRHKVTPWRAISLGEAAHNVGSSSGGPRGDAVRSAALADDPENLLLLCATHHAVADGLPDEYCESVLTGWKAQHESAVFSAAQLSRGRVVLPLIVRASQIGGHDVTVHEAAVIRALLDEGCVPADRPFQIVLDTRGQEDDTDAYWAQQVNTLRHDLRLCLRAADRQHHDAPIAVFALAEMPSLMALGHALGDKRPIQIHQFTRHNGSWHFQNPHAQTPEFNYSLPQSIGDAGVALVLGLTAPVEPARVRAAVGPELSIANISATESGTEMVTSAETVTAFRQAFRSCLDRIEQLAPRRAPIHLFPCMPASLCVAAGGCVMPKVANPLLIYDAKGYGGPFRRCLELPLSLTAGNELST